MTSFEIVLFTKLGGPLTKRIRLDASGKCISDGSACRMSDGSARRTKVAGVAGLAELLVSLSSKQAIVLGAFRDGLPEKVAIVTKKRLNGFPQPDVIARTKSDIVYKPGVPALVLFDYDTKGMPTAVANELRRLGGFWPALVSVLPALSGVARVSRRSTSAGLFHGETGKKIPGSDGEHVYVGTRDGSDIERFLRAAHERCWLAGLGWYVVSSSGQLLERSIIDRMVGSAERLVFEGGPILEPPLKQDQKSRRPVVVEGDIFDSAAACPPLSIIETAKVDKLKAREAHRLAGEVTKARTVFIERQAKHLCKRVNIPEHAARKVITRQCEGILLPDVALPFDDPDLAGVTVADVLADPERFAGETLADPLEGTDYGTNCAKVMRRADGTPWIHSFAHGRTIYELKYDAASVRRAMEEAAEDKAVKVYIKLAVDGDLDAEELEELRRLAAKRSGVGLRVIDGALKAAQKKRASQRAEETRNRQRAARRDPRPMIPAPSPVQPFLPLMGVLNEVMCAVASTIPPLRNIEGGTTRTRKLPVPDMHGFTQAETNVEEDKE